MKTINLTEHQINTISSLIWEAIDAIEKYNLEPDETYVTELKELDAALFPEDGKELDKNETTRKPDVNQN